MSDDSPEIYRERLWPSASLMAVLALLIPATMLTVMPINQNLALPIALAVYLFAAAVLLFTSPRITVSEGILIAGDARIPAAALGSVETLDAGTLRHRLGPGADARAYLLVRGFIHQGVQVTVSDTSDSTPYWVLTSRRPDALASAILAAKQLSAL